MTPAARLELLADMQADGAAARAAADDRARAEREAVDADLRSSLAQDLPERVRARLERIRSFRAVLPETLQPGDSTETIRLFRDTDGGRWPYDDRR